MKSILTSLVLAMSAVVAGAAPRIHLSTPKLGPGTEIELVFDKAAVPDSMIGKEMPASEWLLFTPVTKARIKWKTPNIAQVMLDDIPAIGSSYQCSVKGGHKYQDGTRIPAGDVGKIETKAFEIAYKRVFREGSNRLAGVIVRFNDDVDPAKAAEFFHFVDARKRRVAAKALRPSKDDVPSYYRQASWSDRFRALAAKQVGKPVPKAGQNNIIAVVPAAPLPIGKGWVMVGRPGVPNAAGTATTDSAFSERIGDVVPFELKSIEGRVSISSPRRIGIEFSEPLPEDFDAARFIQIDPKPAKLSYKISGDMVWIKGNLQSANRWAVAVKSDFESISGLPLVKGGSKTVTFKPLKARLAIPSKDGPQLAAGCRTYRIATVNIAKLRVRAKGLSGKPLLRAMQGFRHYTGDGPDSESFERVSVLPWELIDGETLFDVEIPIENPVDGPLDKLVYSTLDWDKLLPAGSRNATFFLEIDGTPEKGVDSMGDRSPVAQAIVQLTDIGVGWKLAPSRVLLYAFSLETGEPLPKVEFEFFGEDAKPLASAVSDENGLVSMPRDSAARHLLARLGKDVFVTAFDKELPTVGLWHFPVRYSWREPKTSGRKVFLFTDRSLYRPGETIRLKGIVRRIDGNAINPADAGRTRLIVTDPAEREIRTEDIKLSKNGTFDFTMRLPAETVGTFEFRFEYADDIERAEEIEDWSEQWEVLSNARFRLDVPVAEFRRNAFEIVHKLATPAPGAKEVALDLTANYYQGRPVAKGKVQVWTRITNRNFYPERFRDFLFGDHRSYDPWYWAYYFGYEDGYMSSRSKAETAKLELDENGHATVRVPMPETKLPSTRKVRIATEVTDPNHQTLNQASETMVHPASVYAGVGRVDKLVRVGDTLDLPVVAVTSKGKPFDKPVDVKVTVTREVNEQVKILGKNGRTAVRNEERILPVSETTLSLDPKANATQGTPFAFHPTHPGRHVVAVSGTDPEGRPFLTQVRIHVWGSHEYPWAYEDGVKIKLVPEKRRYLPGDIARILVLSPIEGTALVTVEREDVLRSFRIHLTTDKPVIEIPLSDADAPNTYVSVLVVKGSKDSVRKYPEPQLRLGYCELTVENVRDRLAVNVEAVPTTQAGVVPTSVGPPRPGENPKLPEFLPGETVTLTGTVRRADGTPASGAEVTVWAEDEGVLAVMGYDCPKPMGYFYSPRNLAIRTGTSMEMLLPESPDAQQFFNKGFWVGGGGWDEADSSRMRRDFRPCAVWAPSLVADENGAFTVSFVAPDTLTRYRIFAVACEGGARFGADENALVVNRPLMLQPKAPRFALEGDTLVLPVTIQNSSDYAGTWKLTLKQNDLVAVEENVELGAGKSATLSHAVAFDATGETVFQWTAVPVSLQKRPLDKMLSRRLSDAVEHRVPVDYPAPLLRAIRTVSLKGGAAPRDLLDGIDSALRQANGNVELELARSPLLEAGGAVDYLLHYPYGCVEQTTSSLMPWFAVKSLKPYVPAFGKVSDEKVDKAIAKGVERLLAMQLPDGGFSYWIGGRERVDWASSYAGFALVLAKHSGADVPESAIDLVGKDLARSLRGLDEQKSSYELELAARSLWVAALAGHPEESYRNKLIARIGELNHRARCLLALATVAEGTNGSREIAKQILTDPTSYKAQSVRSDRWYWMPHQPTNALELLAWATVDPESEKSAGILDRLLRDRSPYGHWYTTWCNAWSLLGMAAYAEHNKETLDRSVAITIAIPGGKRRTVMLNSDKPTATLRLPLKPGLTLPATTDGPAFIRVNLAAKPVVAPLKPVARNGLEITRTWELVHPNGKREPLATPHPGDLVLVTLKVTLPNDETRYLVVEDRLPAVFETINEEFASQKAEGARTYSGWRISHKELRGDRAVFFLDHVPYRGTYTIQYLARCTLAGAATAPPAKVESMYDPENLALSASRQFTAK